jgi:hypothetical protein
VVPCKSVWGCPRCSAAIRAERAEEIRDVLARYVEVGRDVVGERWGALLVTLTIRHGAGDDLRSTRKGLSRAYRRLRQGRWWVEFRERVRLDGSVRAWDLTHGEHGWHPHLHGIWFVRDPSLLERCRDELSDRWRACVRLEMGEAYVPDDEHGCVVSLGAIGSYVAKLGLELASVGSSKVAREGHRTPWQIAVDWTEHHRPEDQALWKAYLKGTHGWRFLEWTRAFRAVLEVPEREDPPAPDSSEEVVAKVMPDMWRELAGTTARREILACVESGGSKHDVGEIIFRALGIPATEIEWTGDDDRVLCRRRRLPQIE